MAYILLFVLIIAMTSIILDSQLGRALAKRLERPETRGAVDDGRVDALEAEVERLAQELARLEEQGEFLQRLLAERPEPRALPGADRTTEDDPHAERSTPGRRQPPPETR